MVFKLLNNYTEVCDDKTQGLRFITLLQKIHGKMKSLYLERGSLQELLERFQYYQLIGEIESNELKKKLAASKGRCQLLEQQLKHIQKYLSCEHESLQVRPTRQLSLDSPNRDHSIPSYPPCVQRPGSCCSGPHGSVQVQHGLSGSMHKGYKRFGKNALHHFGIKLAEIPFVPGQSTSASHSLGANLQNTFAVLQKHSRLCSAGSHGSSQPLQNGCLKPHLVKTKYLTVPSSTKVKASSKGIQELIKVLQEEHSMLKLVYEDRCCNLAQVKREDLKANLIREVEIVSHHLEMKKQQLDQLQAIKLLVQDIYKKHKTTALSGTITCWHSQVATNAASRSGRQRSQLRSALQGELARIQQRKQFLQHLKDLQADLC